MGTRRCWRCSGVPAPAGGGGTPTSLSTCRELVLSAAAPSRAAPSRRAAVADLSCAATRSRARERHTISFSDITGNCSAAWARQASGSCTALALQFSGSCSSACGAADHRGGGGGGFGVGGSGGFCGGSPSTATPVRQHHELLPA